MGFPVVDRFKILQQQVSDAQQIVSPAPPFRPQMTPGLVIDYIARTDVGYCLKVIPFTPKTITEAGELTFDDGTGGVYGIIPNDAYSRRWVPVYPIDTDPGSVQQEYKIGQPITYYPYFGTGAAADTVRGTYVCENTAANTFFPVILAVVGGTQAQYVNNTLIAASWRYNVYDLNNNLLAVNVPLYTARHCNVGLAPAVTGTATIAPQLFVPNPGTVPPASTNSSSSSGGYGGSSSSSSGTSVATPIRLWTAHEMEYEDVDCVPSSNYSSSSATSSSSSSGG